MGWSRTTVAGVLSVGVVGLALAAWAQDAAKGAPADHGRTSRGDRHVAWMQKELGLSDAQVGEIRARREKDGATSKDRWAKERAANDTLEKLMAAPEPDRAAIGEQVRLLSEVRNQAFEARIDERLALQQILTPEQRAKLQERKADRGKRRIERVRRHMRHRDGSPDGAPPVEPPPQ